MFLLRYLKNSHSAAGRSGIKNEQGMKRRTYWIQIAIAAILFVGAGMAEGQSYDAFINQLTGNINQFYTDEAHDNLYVHTDREVYFPGDEMHVAMFNHDAANLRPSERSSKASLLLVDDRGRELITTSFELSEGRSWGTVKLPSNLSDGTYYLAAVPASGNRVTAAKVYQKKIFIANPEPSFLLNYSFDKPVYQSGETVKLELEAAQFAGRPLRRYTAHYEVQSGGEVRSDGRERADRDGRALVGFTMPGDGQEPVKLDLLVEKRKDEKRFTIAVPREPGVEKVTFFPEGGKVVPGTPQYMAYRVNEGEGRGVEFSGVLKAGEREVLQTSTLENGTGIFRFTPEAGVTYVLESDDGSRFPLPEPVEEGVALRVVEQSPVRMKVQTAHTGMDPGTRVRLVLFRKGLIYWAAPGTLEQTEELTVSLRRTPEGVARLVMFNEDGEVLSERMVYNERKSSVGISVETDREEYGSRKLVDATVEIDGLPSGVDAVQLAVSVVPQSLSLQDKMWVEDYLLVDADLDASLGSEWTGEPGEIPGGELLEAHLLSYPWNGYEWNEVLGEQGGEGIKGEKDPGMLDTLSAEEGIASESYYPELPAYDRILDYSAGILDKRMPGVDEPAYKQQLENGVPLKEVLKSIKPYQMYGNRIVFPGTTNSINFQQGALIIVDDQQMGEDASVLDQIPPADVESITVSTNPGDIQQYTGLNSVGVIVIETKGSGMMNRLNQSSDRDNRIAEKERGYMEGYPDYRKEKDAVNVVQDRRPLLYWNPNLVLEEGALGSLEFFTPDIAGTYVIRIEGVAGTMPVAAEKTFRVK